jgi:hypothetical protein
MPQQRAFVGSLGRERLLVQTGGEETPASVNRV